MATEKQIASLKLARAAKKNKKILDENSEETNDNCFNNTLTKDIMKLSNENLIWREAFFTVMKNRGVKVGTNTDIQPCKIAADLILELFQKEDRV